MKILKRFLLASIASTIAFLPTTLPVQAENATKGTITIKLSEPLQGRSFSLYQVEDSDGSFTKPFQGLTTYLYKDASSTLQNKDMDTARKIQAYIDDNPSEDYQPYTLTYTNTEQFVGLDQGLYLVTQTGVPQGYEKMESFLVDIPYTVDSTHLTYSVECNPKTEKVKPAETPKPSAKPSKKPGNEKGKTALPVNERVVYGIGLVLAGTAILAVLNIKRKEVQENG